MFDDVLKGSKARSSTKQRELASKENKVEVEEEVKSVAPKKINKSGKRTDPSYKQVGAYIRKDTYLQIQKLLLDKPDKDFSALVQELLSAYLDNQLTD